MAGVSVLVAGVVKADCIVSGACRIDYYYSVIVLALDTTTRDGSSALACGLDVREEGGEAGRSHAERLPLALMAMLDRAGAALGDVDLFAVATGPGSFTGIRVGIATMQGLAFAQGKPLFGVSALDALAAIGEQQIADGRSAARPIATWIDAWRGEIFAALFQQGRLVEGPSVEPPAVVLDRMTGARPLFIGDAAAVYADLIRQRLGADAPLARPPAPLLAATIARLAAAAAEAGHRPSPDAITPLYVRRTDAELSRDARAAR
jgi:tRNA threonylcarbamoyladenosine biosynthesis protein TsaB